MELNTFSERARQLLFFAVQVLLLCYLGFYNNYPLVYPDTGMYIRSGFELFVPDDRPIVYGLFIRLTSLGEFLWLVVLAQGIILAWVMNRYFKLFCPEGQQRWYALLLLAPLLLCTGLSVHVSQLIPDIFTPILLLALGLMLFTPAESFWTKLLLSLIVALSIAMHNAHFLITLLLLLCFTVIAWWKRKKLKGTAVLNAGKLLWVWLLWGFTLLASLCINYKFDNRFTLSKGTHVFQMLHLVELGFAQEYMNEHCGERNFRFCQYRDSIPFDFMWDPASPLYKTGGWEANREEYLQMEREILGTPKYFILFCAKSIEYTFRQFFSFESGDAPPLRKGSSPYVAIDKHFKRDLRQYNLSLQTMERLDFHDLNNRQLILVLVSGLMLLLLFFHPQLAATIPVSLRMISLFILLAMLVNSCICATFATVVPRYQSRLIWILPLLLTLVLAQKETRELLFAKVKRFFNQ